MTFRSYDARHTVATLLLQDKTSPKVVSERLGHASVKITQDVYGHVMPGMQEDAAARVDRALEDVINRRAKNDWVAKG